MRHGIVIDECRAEGGCLPLFHLCLSERRRLQYHLIIAYGKGGTGNEETANAGSDNAEADETRYLERGIHAIMWEEYQLGRVNVCVAYTKHYILKISIFNFLFVSDV